MIVGHPSESGDSNSKPSELRNTRTPEHLFQARGFQLQGHQAQWHASAAFWRPGVRSGSQLQPGGSRLGNCGQHGPCEGPLGDVPRIPDCHRHCHARGAAASSISGRRCSHLHLALPQCADVNSRVACTGMKVLFAASDWDPDCARTRVGHGSWPAFFRAPGRRLTQWSPAVGERVEFRCSKKRTTQRSYTICYVTQLMRACLSDFACWSLTLIT